ncbi:hypothetical protein [Paraburkholderia sp. BL6665CI2N2]|uniref:hypothetical protein n=1 Tax=Paraburkholderia sp. BL6665CI2N2 TaxID=1938806 RepID=UPI0010664263|nr:hypothetical protein [Paraburkholderia sp. BL6665CI2N2]
MDYRSTYEHGLMAAPNDFIVHVPSQMICDETATVPRALLPEFVVKLIRERSPSIGRIRNLRILS